MAFSVRFPTMRGLLFIFPGLLLMPAMALADVPAGEALGVREIRLEVAGAGPGNAPGRVAIQSASGWPLTVNLVANEQKLLGIGVPELLPPERPQFPITGNTGYLVFDDPDGCPSFVDEDFQAIHADPDFMGVIFDSCPKGTEPPWPFDETWVKFTLGLTMPGSGAGDQPRILAFDDTTGQNDRLAGIGPVGITDEYGYGPSRRLPGLVLVADAGPSIVTDEHFNRPETLECRNLAGFANAVSYQLANSDRRTSITAHFHIPPLLFTPVALVDRNVSTPGACGEGFAAEDIPNGTLLRIDGGDLQCIEGFPLNALDSLVNPQVVTARMFVVNVKDWADAPAVIQDLNGNGYCDAEDAMLAGYEVLSIERRIRFRQIHEFYFGLPFDFDGDGDIGGIVLPGGAGQLTQIPR